MSDIPILFSAPMVRALLDGRKTMTRRILKPQIGDIDKPFMMDDGSWHATASDGSHMSPIKARYQVSDRLWVREAWRIDGAGSAVPHNVCRGNRAPEYRADGYAPIPFAERSSIHMPRWASRLTLIVTRVKVERLNDISYEDAEAEGLVEIDSPDKDGGRHFGIAGSKSIDAITSRHAFAALWQSINGPGSWDANPWVVAVSFEVRKCNIDRVAV